jgi:hypothetical protein
MAEWEFSWEHWDSSPQIRVLVLPDHSKLCFARKKLRRRGIESTKNAGKLWFYHQTRGQIWIYHVSVIKYGDKTNGHLATQFQSLRYFLQ